jgi:hypothetical protein
MFERTTTVGPGAHNMSYVSSRRLERKYLCNIESQEIETPSTAFLPNICNFATLTVSERYVKLASVWIGESLTIMFGLI